MAGIVTHLDKMTEKNYELGHGEGVFYASFVMNYDRNARLDESSQMIIANLDLPEYKRIPIIIDLQKRIAVLDISRKDMRELHCHEGNKAFLRGLELFTQKHDVDSILRE
ncbi:MAG: hypothetical protein AABW79_04155 [Nanoarchaeota archaeon]